MIDPATPRELIAAIYTVPAVAWGAVTRNYVHLIRTRLPKVRTFWLFPCWAGLVTLLYLVLAFEALAESHPRGLLHGVLGALATIAVVGVAALARHMIVNVTAFLPGSEGADRGWLARDYGSALVVGGIALLPLLGPAPGWMTFHVRLPLARAT